MLGLINITFTIVGAYNFVKGIYNMYCDAQKIKDEYKDYQKNIYNYKREQHLINTSLTESMYHRMEEEFLILQGELPPSKMVDIVHLTPQP